MEYIDSIELKVRGDLKVLATLDYETQRADMVAVLRVTKIVVILLATAKERLKGNQCTGLVDAKSVKN